MPSRNSVKIYTENTYYHIYNRGVEKREIFLDLQDCKVFLRYLKLYLSPPEEVMKIAHSEPRALRFLKHNMWDQIDLISFALMPNHFHLQVYQRTERAIAQLLQRVCVAYAMYFNNKYERVGGLLQGTYKGAVIIDDAHHLHLSKYINLNHTKLPEPGRELFRGFSSLDYYLGEKKASWVKPEIVLSRFNSAKKSSPTDMFSYESFLEKDNDTKHILAGLTLENDD